MRKTVLQNSADALIFGRHPRGREGTWAADPRTPRDSKKFRSVAIFSVKSLRIKGVRSEFGREFARGLERAPRFRAAPIFLRLSNRLADDDL